MDFATVSSKRLVPFESKIILLYFSALLGASLAEIEVCRSGLWGCHALRGAWVVSLSATPMILILAFIPINRLMFTFLSLSLGAILFLLGVNSGNSVGSLTWAAHHVTLLVAGSLIAILFLSLSIIFRKPSDPSIPPPPPPLALSLGRQYSNKLISISNKLWSLCIGAFFGGLLGQIIIVGSNNGVSGFHYEEIKLSDIPSNLILISSFNLAPTLILLAELKLSRFQLISASVIIGLFSLFLTILYGEFDNLFGHYRLGYYSLWFAGILAAFMTVTVQKRRICGQTFSSRA